MRSGQRQQLDIDEMRRGRFLIGNIILCLATIFFFMMASIWFFSDISGEYSMPGRGAQVRICLVRKATTLWGELTFGRGSVLKLITTEVPKDEMVNLVFETSEEWVSQGHPRRQISFVGTVKDGEMKGEFIDGKKRMKAKLVRSGYNSLIRQIQSHIPGNSN